MLSATLYFVDKNDFTYIYKLTYQQINDYLNNRQAIAEIKTSFL